MSGRSSASGDRRQSGRDGVRWSLPLVVGALLSGCAAPRLAPADLSAPGWRVQEVPAVWRPRRDAPELIGELLVATHPGGDRLVQFSKQALPVVTAQVAEGGWVLSSPLRRGRFGGRRNPTDRVPWFRLSGLPPGAEAGSGRWRLTPLPDGAWRLSNDRTGESLEGVAP